MEEKSLRHRQLLLVWLVIPPLLLLAVTLPIVLIFTVFKDVITGDAVPTIWQIILLILVLVVPATVFTMLIMHISQGFAKQTFDPMFQPLGLFGSSYLNQGRQYHGTIQGRRVDVYLHPVMRQRSVLTLPGLSTQAMTYFGHVLQIYVEAKSTGKFGLSLLGVQLPTTGGALDVPSAVLNKIQDKIFTHSLSAVSAKVAAANQVTTFHPSQAALHDFTVTTFDRAWADQLLQDETLLEPMRQLVLVAPHSLMFTVQALPASVKLAMHVDKQKISAHAVLDWVNDLIRFAAAIESGPQPSVTFAENRFEHLARTNPGYFTQFAIAAVIGFFLVLGAGITLLFLTLYYFGLL